MATVAAADRDKMLFLLIILLITTSAVTSSSDNPIRHRTEEDFFRAKSHERSLSINEMNNMINVIHKRRHYQKWDPKNEAVKSKLNGKPKPPNILFILADDLG